MPYLSIYQFQSIYEIPYIANRLLFATTNKRMCQIAVVRSLLCAILSAQHHWIYWTEKSTDFCNFHMRIGEFDIFCCCSFVIVKWGIFMIHEYTHLSWCVLSCSVCFVNIIWYFRLWIWNFISMDDDATHTHTHRHHSYVSLPYALKCVLCTSTTTHHIPMNVLY